MGDFSKNSGLVYSRNTTETEEDPGKKQQRMKLLRRKQAIATFKKPAESKAKSSLKNAKGGEKT